MAKIDIENLLIHTPLYTMIEVDESDYPELFQLYNFRDRLDFHCIECEDRSTFEGTSPMPKLGNGTELKSYKDLQKIGNVETRKNEIKRRCYKPNQMVHVNMICTRQRTHKSTFSFYVTETWIMKIGQYPSIAVLNSETIQKYKKVLSKEQFKELNKGIGLTAHGVGIGAFVYLRRIFEQLIGQAKAISIESGKLKETSFKGKRLTDQIKLLKDFVPEFLYEHRDIYGILSKGIHELSENECLEYFPIMQTGIELILDEKYEAKLKREKQLKIGKEVEKIKSKLKPSDNK